MKWAIPQLRKLSKPFFFKFDFDLTPHLQTIDALSAKNCVVEGTCREIGDDTYQFDIIITADLYLECSVTLDEVLYHFSSEIEGIFGYDDDYSSVNLITKDTINLTDCVISEIIVSKPMKIVKEGFEDYYSENS